MTRATLLHVLDYPTDLGPAEVRELEQLAQAFPYCQTAHLLLAKAAHDQGTMLASQRLRRAATYAADRTLLRRLIEQEAPAPALAATTDAAVAPASPAPPVEEADIAYYDTEKPAAAVPSPTPQPEPRPLPQAATVVSLPAPIPEPEPEPQPLPQIATVALPIPPPEPEPEPEPELQPLPPVAAISPPALLPEPEPQHPSVGAHDAPVTVVGPAPEPLPAQVAAPPAPNELLALALPAIAPPLILPVVEPATTPETGAAPEPEVTSITPVAAELLSEPAPEHTSKLETESPPPALEPVEIQPIEATPMGAIVSAAETAPVEAEMPPLLIDRENVVIESTVAVEPESLAADVAPETVVAVAPEIEEMAPPQAPAIRAPVEVGEARFEFGLAEPLPPARSAYELPGLVDEWAASAVTRGLGTPEALVTAVATAAPGPPVFTPSAFTGDAEVGYGFGEGSRLGFSLQLLQLLTDAAETATSQEVATQVAVAPLPPAGTFFEPDPLLLDHWVAHRPATPELPSTIDLINNFLKRQPRLTRPGMLPPAPGGQPDLSVRSTRAEPNLVSENLARIFVRQGKTARAIEIYEKLIVKQPEKMAYFTAQIQQLQPLA